MKIFLVYFVNQFGDHHLQSIFDSVEKAEQCIVDARARRVRDNHYLTDDSFYIEGSQLQ